MELTAANCHVLVKRDPDEIIGLRNEKISKTKEMDVGIIMQDDLSLDNTVLMR